MNYFYDDTMTMMNLEVTVLDVTSYELQFVT